MKWSPEQYRKFERERNRPIGDLLARVSPEGVRTAVDLGCGPGNSTEALRTHLPGAQVTGIDLSPEMVAAARERLPGVRFEVGDIGTWNDGETYDLIFANAALQWVPDHAALLPRLLERLAPGGRLAVQMPDNLGEPAHVLMREIAADGPWAERLARIGDGMPPRHPAEWYFDALRDLGADVDLWRTTYYHELTGGAGAIVEWFRGTGLRPFLAPLQDGEEAEYLARYGAALASAYPSRADGTVLLPFPRLFFVARSRAV